MTNHRKVFRRIRSAGLMVAAVAAMCFMTDSAEAQRYSRGFYGGGFGGSGISISIGSGFRGSSFGRGYSTYRPSYRSYGYSNYRSPYYGGRSFHSGRSFNSFRGHSSSFNRRGPSNFRYRY